MSKKRSPTERERRLRQPIARITKMTGQTKVKAETIISLAQEAANNTFRKLIATTDLNRLIALECAKDAGDTFASRLRLSLKEHGVLVG
jgi:glycerol-3-phosphate dehydrogenase